MSKFSELKSLLEEVKGTASPAMQDVEALTKRIKDKDRVRRIMAQNRKEGKRKLRALDKDAPK